MRYEKKKDSGEKSWFDSLEFELKLSKLEIVFDDENTVTMSDQVKFHLSSSVDISFSFIRNFTLHVYKCQIHELH